MTTYSIAAFFHLIFLLLASSAMSLNTFAAVRLRAAHQADEAARWIALVAGVSRVFPVAAAGLLASGAWMTQERWGWSIPWIDAALVGLALLVVLGAGVEASRLRALRRELQISGMVPRVQRLLRDPVAWTARTTGITLLIAVVFVMTVKPAAVASACSIALAFAVGVIGAIPMWI